MISKSSENIFLNGLFFLTENHSWSQPMQMNRKGPTPRAALAMCSVNHHLVIFGGRDSTGRQNDLHIYDTRE